LRVLIVEQGGRGGVADYTGRLAEALSLHDVNVCIATATDHLYHLPPEVEVVPVFTYVRGTSSARRLLRRAGLGRLVNGLMFLSAMPRLVALARRYDVVHVQGWERTSLGIVAMLCLDAAGARTVYTSHNTFKRKRQSLDAARVLPLLARATIVHTEADRRRIGREVVVIPHGNYGGIADSAPRADPAHARQTLGIPPDAPVVMLFGVLRTDKGIGDLLTAAVSAPEWHVLNAGEEHGGLAAVAAQLNDPRLTGRITVCEGFLLLDAVARCFAAADIVALPYRQASQSGVLHLAYGFARPVAAYPVGGLVEAVIDGESGWLCREASARALACTLLEAGLAGRPELRRRGTVARSWSERRFDWATIAQATEAVYESVLARPGRP